METSNGLVISPTLFQTVVLIDAARNHQSFYIINLMSPYFKLFSKVYYSIFSLYGNTFDHLLLFVFIMSARE